MQIRIRQNQITNKQIKLASIKCFESNKNVMQQFKFHFYVNSKHCRNRTKIIYKGNFLASLRPNACNNMFLILQSSSAVRPLIQFLSRQYFMKELVSMIRI